MRKTNLLAIVLLAGLATVSCKKSYTCDCITTETVYGNPTVTLNYNSTSVAYSEKMKEKQAKAACQHEQDSQTSTYKALLTNNGQAQANPNDVITVSCTLK